MKKRIKINFKYFGPGFNSENNLFTNLLREKYNVVISENPDFLFYSVYPEIKKNKDLSEKGDLIRRFSPKFYTLLRKIYVKLKSIFRKNKSLVPKGNFVRIFFGAENVKPNMEECDWAFSTYFEEEINNPRYMRIPPYIMFDYSDIKKWIPKIKKKINFKKIKKEKTKFCNFIYSQDIKFRNDFFRKLSEYKRIDSPGRCMNNMPPIGNHESAKKSREQGNWASQKLKFLKPYKFTIAFENTSISGWVTEKLTHPMIVNSIPIYFGHDDVKRDFNTKSFINYHDFKNVDKFIEHIIKVDNDDNIYRQYLEQPWYNENKMSKYASKKRYLDRLSEIIETGLNEREKQENP